MKSCRTPSSTKEKKQLSWGLCSSTCGILLSGSFCKNSVKTSTPRQQHRAVDTLHIVALTSVTFPSTLPPILQVFWETIWFCLTSCLSCRYNARVRMCSFFLTLGLKRMGGGKIHQPTQRCMKLTPHEMTTIDHTVFCWNKTQPSRCSE